MKFIKIFAFIAALFLFLPITGSTSDKEGMPNLLKGIKQIEYNLINYDTPSAEYFGYIKGRIPILISAPHGAKHFRSRWGRYKEEDAYTSAIAIKLGELTGAHVIYLKNKSPEDPNSDINCTYKNFLKKVVEQDKIKFLLDLHGAGVDQPFKIDVGTFSNDPNKSSCPIFKKTIEEAFHGFDTGIFNKKFSARGSGTITCFARKRLGIESAQVEINANCRIIESKSNGFRATCSDVEDLVTRLQKLILAINDQILKSRS